MIDCVVSQGEFCLCLFQMSIFNMAKACIINSIESDVYREFVKSNDYRQMQTLQDAAHK